MIRIAVLAALALGALAAPALAFETHSAPAPNTAAPHFVDGGKILRMMPATTTEAFRFGPADAVSGPADQPGAKRPTVVYELHPGKTADRVDVTSPRDNPFMPQPERSDRAAP